MSVASTIAGSQVKWPVAKVSHKSGFILVLFLVVMVSPRISRSLSARSVIIQ